MARKKLPIEEKKEKLTVTISPDLYKTVMAEKLNVSKYIEKLVYKDLLEKKLIDENFEL